MFMGAFRGVSRGNMALQGGFIGRAFGSSRMFQGSFKGPFDAYQGVSRGYITMPGYFKGVLEGFRGFHDVSGGLFGAFQ